MKKLYAQLFLLGIFFVSCSKEETPQDIEEKEIAEEVEEVNLEVEEFIFNGMNEIYLYKADVPVLADDYFANDTDGKKSYLSSFDAPEDLFDALQSSQDRFSFMTADYVALENRFNGISLTTGMKYGLTYIGESNDVLGYVQYVLPGTSAEEKGIKRGDVFTEVNGTQMTGSNYSALLGQDSYTINMGRIENGQIQMTDNLVTLTGTEYTANPVLISKVLDVEGIKVGYIMYNSFTGSFDSELNAAFAELKSQNVQELVLDLRYNGGGSVETAVDLASMITGQFEGEVFMKEQWNEKYQNAWDPESYINRFNNEIRTGETINSLNLNKVYVLTTGRSASASELVINGLDPYIDVIQVGTTTTGKFQASVTLYDSSNFGREKANKNHTYAIQPLVLKSVNSAGVSDYVNGLAPNITQKESLSNLGTLGDPSEPLFQAALNHILGKSQVATSAAVKRAEEKYKMFGGSDMFDPTYERMYIDELPAPLTRE